MNRGDTVPESRDPARLRAELTKAHLRASLLGAPLDPPRIGRFALRQWLGQGASGAVYAAEDLTSGAPVALKLLRTRDAQSVADFKREFRALADVVHENLVQLYELFGDAHGFYLSMELVRGVRFTRFARDADGRCDEAKLRAALGQLLSGVRAIHDAGKLHRDLKPSNVLVTDGGRVVVLDFGLLVAQRANDVVRQPAGTPEYMAPEVAAGAPPTPASDLYAIGVMLFQVLTGAVPFPSGLPAGAPGRQPPRPRDLAPATNPELDALCAALLAFEPDARPSLEAALDALQLRAAPARASRQPEHAALLGRDAELGALRAAASELTSGQPRALFVHGPSGIGKSALADRFAAELDGRAVLLRGRCHERESLSYKAFDGVIDALAEQLHALPPESIAALSERERAALLRVFPSLRACRQLAAGPFDPEQLSPQRARLLAFSALKRLLRELARRAPLVLLVDDLQWADLDSARLLLDLLGPPDAPALLYVGCYRDEELERSEFLRALLRPDGSSELSCAFDSLALGPLPEAAAAQLAFGLLPAPSEQRQRIGERIAREAGGVPLLVRELCAYFAHELAGDATALSLSDLLSRRLAALGASERRVLSLLAVAARPLGEELLDRALPETSATQRARRVLAIEHLIHADARGRLLIYHDRLREQVVHQLSARDAAALHRSLAEAYEQGGPSEPEWLIEHWRAAGEAARAFEYAVTAAGRAAAKLAFHRAAALYTTALELLPEQAPRASELHAALGDALVNAGRGAEAAQHYLLAAAGAGAEAAYGLRCRAAQQYLRTGHEAEATALLEQLFREAGSRYPQGAPEVVLQLLLSRGRLALRAKLPRALAAGSGPGPERRLSLLRAVFRESAIDDPLRGLLFQSWFSEAALSAGDRESEFLGAAWDTYHRTFLGSQRTDGEIAKQLDRLDRMAAELGTPYAAGTAGFVRGAAAILQGHFGPGAVHISRAQRVFREQCAGATWEESTCAIVHYMALENCGPLSEICRSAPELVRRANENVDQFTDRLLSAHMGCALLIEDRGEEAVRFLKQRLPAPPAKLDAQRFSAFLRLVDALIYTGDASGAFELVEATWPVYLRSGYDRSELLSVFTHMRRAHAALMAGVERRDQALFAIAEDAAARISRVKRPYAQVVVDSIRGVIAAHSGQPLTAVQRLHAAQAVARALGVPVPAHCYQLALGHVVPGSEGEQLRAEAAAALRAEGVVDPLRFSRIYISGLY